MSACPRVSIGLPVYNGEDYLAQSLDALLGQTYEDLEVVISSNASTDGTDDICRRYAVRDERVRYERLPRNVGAAANHDVVLRRARGELFKWASADDLYAADLVEQCVRLLDQHPDAVLAHSWTAAVDEDGTVTQAHEYPLCTAARRAPERLRSMLFDGDDMPGAIRADDFYGVVRTDVLRQVPPHGSYYRADQVFVTDLALRGRFVQVPDWLYFRRHHADRLSNDDTTIREWCAGLDPRRAQGWRHPTARLVGELVWAYAAALRHAPLTPAERRECERHLVRWALSRARRRVTGRSIGVPAEEYDVAADRRDLARRVVVGQGVPG
ncbi:Spore coat polysaccharide biosynthesis protein SpsA [Nocardioides dokdonensis FR1436]|uniref:Spore coat polysaccharide biosynthesis protein SpsA n=1 Tax=Nocardioides dokdonensis FR1436 TaxID=1300347 RepID=A0A1A9GER9_9ACTN|nr:glycosyltransferase family 2 protein [Nocardioides dokdonensis]ANH36556.1 Spore coat polysaccharide biosynthesis protein SpsA [Nocardioides dokdonensis FR1436]